MPHGAMAMKHENLKTKPRTDTCTNEGAAFDGPI